MMIHAQSIIISEFMADNQSFLKDNKGKYSDWIELENQSSDTFNLSGYYISDNLDKPLKHRFGEIKIPPQSQMLFWANKDSTKPTSLPFKLSKKGGDIVLTYPNGKRQADFASYSIQIPNHSWVRFNDETYITTSPSPGIVNPDSLNFKLAPIPTVVFSKTKEGRKVTIDTEKGYEIQYTLDGSSPFLNTALKYKGPIHFDSTCFIRAAAFRHGALSNLECRKAFIDTSQHTLPIISLLIDRDTLWDEERGLLGAPNSFNKSDAQIKIYNFSNEMIKEDVKTRVFGSGTRFLDKKSITIFGTPWIKNVFFKTQMHNKIDGFILRAAFPSKRFRNELIYDVNNAMNGKVTMQEYLPAVLYINGQYWGLYHLMERKNPRFIKRHNNLIPENIITIMHNGFNFHKGNNKSYLSFIEDLKEVDIESDTAYSMIINNFDIESYFEFWVHELYSNRIDNWNNRLWNSKEDTLWKWISYDYDNTFTNSGKLFIQEKLNSNYDGLIYSIGHFLKNYKFKIGFFEKLMDYVNFGYTIENVQHSIEQQTTLTEKEFYRDYKRWHQEELKSQFLSSNKKRNLLSFIKKRNDFFLNTFASTFNLTKKIFIHPPSKDEGKVYINGYELKSNATYFADMELIIEVIPKKGYLFKEMKSKDGDHFKCTSCLFDSEKEIKFIFSQY